MLQKKKQCTKIAQSQRFFYRHRSFKLLQNNNKYKELSSIANYRNQAKKKMPTSAALMVLSKYFVKTIKLPNVLMDVSLFHDKIIFQIEFVEINRKHLKIA